MSLNFAPLNEVPLNEAGGAIIVEGFLATNIGTPQAKEFFPAASLGKITRFGAVYHVTNKTAVPVGWKASRVGRPFALAAGPTNRIVRPAALRLGLYGIPNVPQDVEVQPFSYRIAKFGAPVAGQFSRQLEFGTPLATIQAAAGSAGLIADYGVPTAVSAHPATGFKLSAVGTPMATRASIVTSGVHTIRFGRPKGSIVGTFKVYPLNQPPLRFGIPRARAFFADVVQASSTGGAQFGTPTANNAVRALPTGPVTRFGTPTIIRGIVC